MSDGLGAPAEMIQRIGDAAKVAASRIHDTLIAYEGLRDGYHKGQQAFLRMAQEMADAETLGVGLWIPPVGWEPSLGFYFSIRYADGSVVWFNSNNPNTPVPDPVITGEGAETTTVTGTAVEISTTNIAPGGDGGGDGGGGGE